MRGNPVTKIIAVMPHGPAYNYHFGAVPEIYWEKPGGGIVGFWSNEWMDVLGAEVLKNTGRYAWEVWQPDYRADNIYSKQMETGVTHRLFPAEDKKYGRWPLARIGLYSGLLISGMEKLEGKRIIVMLYGTYGFRLPFYMELLRAMCRARKIPVFLRSGGMFRAPLSEFPAPHRPLTYLRLLSEHLEMKKLLRRADVISEQSEYGLAELRSVYGGRVEKLTMGCDFTFWVPTPSVAEKDTARACLGIRPGKKVFFASGNFVPRKQLDKLIEVFNSLQEREDFFLIIAGQGNQVYTDMLAGLAAPLVKHKKALLHPYVTGEELRNIYWASDLYVSVATDEGGPASVMKAMACGLPVLSTPVGETADRMRKYVVGKIVPVKKYDEWTKAIMEMLEGKMPQPLDLKIAKEAYDWPNVASRYIRVYDDLISSYYGKR